MAKTVAAIVVAYKNKDDLAACYTQLRESPTIQHIFIVDNAYGEVGSCIEYAGLQDVDDRTHHIVAQKNLGYAAGNNLGIAAARGYGADYVLVCNPDVLIDNSAVDSLLKEMNERRVDLISPRLLEARPGGAKRILSDPGWDFLLGRGVIDIPPSRFTRRYIRTFYGACFLASSSLIDGVGGLSEDFFLYGEEIDYTIRISRSSFSWSISEQCVVSHERGSSISPGVEIKSLISFFHSARSAVIVGRKYWPAMVPGWLLARFALALSMALSGRVSKFRAIAGGLLAGIRFPLTPR